MLAARRGRLLRCLARTKGVAALKRTARPLTPIHTQLIKLPFGQRSISGGPASINTGGGDDSLNYGINDNPGRSGQGLGSWLCAIHLEDIRSDFHDGVVIHALKLEKWITGGNLKPGDEFGSALLPPTAEKDFARQRRDAIGCSNELLIGRR